MRQKRCKPFELSDIVQSVVVDYNDRVRVGQPLAYLDRTKYEAAVMQSRAALESAESRLQEAQATARIQVARRADALLVPQAPPEKPRPPASGSPGGIIQRLWLLAEGRPMAVRTGPTDGTMTVIDESELVREGTEVMVEAGDRRP